MTGSALTIAILNSSTAHGGAELAAANLAHWLAERGHRCLALGVEGSPFLRLSEARGLTCRPVDARMFPRFAAIPAAVRRAVRRDCAAAVLTNGSRDLHAAATASCVSSPFVLAHVQHMQIGRSKRDLLHRLEQRAIDAWIAPLPWLAKQAEALTAIPADRIRVIPHGVDLSRFTRALPSREEARAALALPSDAMIAGTFGRFDRGKGQEYLLRAIAALKNDGIEMHALLIGEDTHNERQGYRDVLLALADEHGIADRVHFRPFMADIETAYRALDLFVLTSISETYGLVTIEAMASSLPVIGTGSAGTPEIIDDGTSGILVPPADVPALAAALRALSRDPDLRGTLGVAARAASERFSHHRQVADVEALLRALLAKRGR